jgi:hypothetical protein
VASKAGFLTSKSLKMTKAIEFKTLIFSSIIAFSATFSMAQNPLTNKQMFKINVGKFQFEDVFNPGSKIEGYSLGVTYELLFARRWSMAVGLEYCRNDNGVNGLRASGINFGGGKPLDLPDKEHRFAFSYDFRYYFKRAGSGFYLGNAVAFHRVRNVLAVSNCEPVNCNPFSVGSWSTFADRFSIGYQTFIDSKAIVGLSIGYEIRPYFSSGYIRSPQIGLHIGFAK